MIKVVKIIKIWKVVGNAKGLELMINVWSVVNHQETTGVYFVGVS